MLNTQNIQVAVRIRPPLPQTSQIEHGKLDSKGFNISKDGNSLITGNNFSYNFDNIFTPASNQNEIFDQAIEPLIDSALQGYNVSILAYGQTGTGKTYTMGMNSTSPNNNHRGIVPRIFEFLFSRLEACETTFEINASFVEVYNEELRDLLSSTQSTKLSIRQDKKGRVRIPDVTLIPISSLSEAVALLECGIEMRSTGETLMNATSSRSHAILTLYCSFQPSNADADAVDDVRGQVLLSKIHLVDLAGSERLKRTGASGQRLVESVGINQGLFVLGKVLNALSHASSNQTTNDKFIPYRESKLTRLLQDSLGGNARVVLIACLSSESLDAKENLETIKYASWARRIKQVPVVNHDDDDEEEVLDRLQQEQQQQQEDDEYNCKLEMLETNHKAELSDIRTRHNEEISGLLNRISELEDLRGFADKVQELSLNRINNNNNNKNINDNNMMMSDMRAKLKEYEEELKRDEVIFAAKVHNVRQLTIDVQTLQNEVASLKKELANEKRFRRQTEVLNKELLIELRGI